MERTLGSRNAGFYRINAKGREIPPHGCHEAIDIRTGDIGQAAALCVHLEAIVPSYFGIF